MTVRRDVFITFQAKNKSYTTIYKESWQVLLEVHEKPNFCEIFIYIVRRGRYEIWRYMKYDYSTKYSYSW